MASDESTSDEIDESETGEPETGEPESGEPESGEPESGEPESGESGSSLSDSLDFGAGAASTAESDDDESDEESLEGQDSDSTEDSEPDSADDSKPDSTADSEPDAADDSKSDSTVDSAEDEDDEDDEEEAYDPSKIPALSERATLFGAWGCVGLVVVVALVFFVMIKSAIDKIDDYGAVASDDDHEESSEEIPPEEPEEPVVAQVTRRLDWPSSYPEARAAARIDLRPIVIVFTAEYATESLDVFDGVFTNDDVENYLERFFQIVHIDMGAQGDPDPSIALCEVEFLPHVCYVHPETEAKLNADTTGMIATSALLRALTTARVAYEANTEGL